MMLPGATFDVRPAVWYFQMDEETKTAMRELVRNRARDEEDEMLLLEILGLIPRRSQLPLPLLSPDEAYAVACRAGLTASWTGASWA